MNQSDPVSPTLHAAFADLGKDVDKGLVPCLEECLRAAAWGNLTGVAESILMPLAKGFMEPFKHERFLREWSPDQRVMKSGALGALASLAEMFETTVPAPVWNVFASLATSFSVGGNPISTLPVAKDLGLPKWAPHVFLCAVLQVPRLKLQIDTVMYLASRHIFDFDPHQSLFSVVPVLNSHGRPGEINCSVQKALAGQDRFVPLGLDLMASIVTQTGIVSDFNLSRGLGLRPGLAQELLSEES